jgi:cysteine-rich repeat protein
MWTRPRSRSMTRQAWCFVCAVSVLGGCGSPTAPGPVDAGVAPDAALSPCTSDRQCSSQGAVCDRDRGVCVQCRIRADCSMPGTACIATRCVPVTTCTTTRMCPRQVCNTMLGYCVDCNADGDCLASQRCVENSCIARPRMCTSSRQCSDLGLVCDTAQGICVECVGDNDCAAGMQFCAAGGRCAARACTPGSLGAVCASAAAQSMCASDGSGFTSAACASGQSCQGGVCAVRCGDGIVGAGETCDDGNTVSGDGCSSACISEGPARFTYVHEVPPGDGYLDNMYNSTTRTGDLNDGLAIGPWPSIAPTVVGWLNVNGQLVVTPPAGRPINTVRIAMHLTFMGGITVPNLVQIAEVASGAVVGTISPTGSGGMTAWFSAPLSRPVIGPLRITFQRRGEWTMASEIELM